MTVRELIEALLDYPMDMPVCYFTDESFDAIEIESLVITNSRIDNTGKDVLELK